MNSLGFYHLINFLEKRAELKKPANHMQFRMQDIFYYCSTVTNAHAYVNLISIYFSSLFFFF